jgi:agmatinase
LVGLIGGDHSTPYGFIQALAERYDSFGILQIDAHCDLRNAYEGFTFSHASVMFNAIQIKNVSHLVQVGIRDFCEEELQVINQNKKITTFFDANLKKENYEGQNWKKQCDAIIKALPNKVYISFDIDGLDPKLCPNTGTPVPGGLEFEHAVYLFTQLQMKGKKIIGFDLNEVAPGKDEWDANVGARMLFKLCHLLIKSNG